MIVSFMNKNSEDGSRLFDKETPVNQAREPAAEHRADPIDRVPGPTPARERRTKNARRVHRGAGERTTEQNVERHREANRQPADLRRTCIDRGAVDNEHEKERQHSLDNDSLDEGDSFGRERRCAVRFDDGSGQQLVVRINLASEEKEEEKSRRNASCKLRNPVGNAVAKTDFSADEEAKGYCGIQVPSGDSARGRNHYCNGQSVREGNGEQARTVIDGADADENQREGADEFSHTLLEQRCLHKLFAGSGIRGPRRRTLWSGGHLCRPTGVQYDPRRIRGRVCGQVDIGWRCLSYWRIFRLEDQGPIGTEKLWLQLRCRTGIGWHQGRESRKQTLDSFLGF